MMMSDGPVSQKRNAIISADSTPGQIPVDLIDVLGKGNAKHVVICGQNLFQLVTNKEFVPAVERFLGSGSSRLDILLSDYRFSAGVVAWSKVHVERKGWQYADHLFESSKQLTDLGATRSNLRVKVIEINPFNGWFIDPTDETNGMMVVTPVVPGLYYSPERPQFFVRRGEAQEAFKRVFDRIWFLIDTPASHILERPSRMRRGYYKIVARVLWLWWRIWSLH